MMTNLASSKISTSIGTINTVRCGFGEQAVLLLHGWPQNHREWLPMIGHLEQSKFDFILPDLPGFGDSIKPMSGYDVKAQADVLLEVLNTLQIDTVHIVAHDIGGPIALALAYLTQDRALSLAMIEAPFWGIESENVPDLSKMFWHIQMHQDVDLATSLIQGKEDIYLDHFFRDFAFNSAAISHNERDQYIHAIKRAGALRGSLMHYHAIPQSASQLAEMSKNLLDIAVLGIGSAAVMNNYCGGAAQLISSRASGMVIADAGHWLPEEKPEELALILSRFWQSFTQPSST